MRARSKIPTGWSEVLLGQFAPLQRGFDLPAREIKAGEYPIVYSNGVGGTHYKAMVRGPGVVTGRSGTLGVVTYVEDDFWPHNTALWVTDFMGNHPKFVFYRYTEIGFERFRSGSGVPTLNRNDAHSYRLVKPDSIDEQRAITSVLADLDELIAALDTLIAKKEAIKLGMMQELLVGKRRLPGFQKPWAIGRLRDVLVGDPQYGLNAPAMAFNPNFPRYLRITDFDEYGRLGRTEAVSVRVEPTERYSLREGDIAVARTGASTGKSYLWRAEDGEMVFAGYLLRIKPDTKIASSSFIAYLLNTQKYWDWIATASQRSGQPGINGTQLASFEMPMPEQKEQTAIARILDDLSDEIEIIKKRRAKTMQMAEGISQQLLTGRIRLA